MKKLILLILLTLIIPFKVSASESINVYLFKGDGCPHCSAAEAFFSDIESEYGKYFNLKEYEVWNSTDNYNLMKSVSSVFDENPQGVPYIVICDKTYNGYSEQYNDTLKEEILACYNSNDYDVMDHLGETKEKETSEITEETIVNDNKENANLENETDVSSYFIIGGTCIGVILIALFINKKIAK